MPESHERTLWSIGHSTRSVEVLVALLAEQGVTALADVRRYPKSRRHPHFDDDSLAAALPEAGVRYVPLRSLGGHRRPLPGPASVNGGWKNESFRGYADFLQTPEFDLALGALERLALDERTAIMCAEAVPWRCHRMLICDALCARGWRVRHVLDAGSVQDHAVTAFARIEDGRVTYPVPRSAADAAQLSLFEGD
jgi:uncharacterized protein (DUF488 family)